uniref:Uncharacterized protein n=1 Tax=Triticum aestivum TaxID=4565 RepID=A0A3B6IXL1_WHEAT
MAPSTLALFLALNQVLLAAVHGCGSYCGNTPAVPVPTSPIAVSPPAIPVPAPADNRRRQRHLLDQHAEAEGVRQRTEPAKAQLSRAGERRLLPAAGRARRPRRRRVPLHRHQGQCPRHQAQRPRRPRSPPQPVRQDLPRRLHLPQL